MKKRKLRITLPLVIGGTLTSIGVFANVSYGTWYPAIGYITNTMGHQYLFNVEFEYLNGTVSSFEGLEKNSKFNLPLFNEDRYTSVWSIGGHDFNPGFVSISDLYAYAPNPSSTISDNGKVTIYTFRLNERRTGVSPNYFEISIPTGINESDSNSELTLNYSLIAKIEANFCVFNIKPTYENLVLTHFVYSDGVIETEFGLNDVLHIDVSGSEHNYLDNGVLTLIAFFKEV